MIFCSQITRLCNNCLSIVLFIFCLCGVTNAQQSYFNGNYRRAGFTTSGYNYTIHDFFTAGSTIKVKYFAQNAYSNYLLWSINHRILLVTAGAFSDSWEPDGKPVGLCVEDGNVINRTPDDKMDGLVVIYNTTGKIIIDDMAVSGVSVKTDTGIAVFYPRSSYIDCYKFLNWSQQNRITLFQTQLVYSQDKSYNFTNPYYGAKRERRFLAVCKKYGWYHQVIVDAPDEIELNLSAKYAKDVLDYDGFTTDYIINLDTGDKNILYFFNGSYLQNSFAYKGGLPDRAKIENATNLLVYYMDY